MSSSDQPFSDPRKARRLLPLAVALIALAGAGCTVRPLYSDPALTPSGQSASAALASVHVKPAKTRYGQEVRNQLIFLLSGGSGPPATPAYELELGVVALRETSATTQTTVENEPSAGSVTVRSTYTLTDVATGKRIARGTRQVSAQYDIPRQEFASYRAQRDAENRAARELAELLKLAIAQDLAHPEGS